MFVLFFIAPAKPRVNILLSARDVCARFCISEPVVPQLCAHAKVHIRSARAAVKYKTGWYIIKP